MDTEESNAMNEEQLLEFCQRLGLAQDGYLDESQLNIICRCIGFCISDDTMKDLFEELDMNHDGKVSISNLCFMLKNMGSSPSSGSNSARSSPEKKMGAKNSTSIGGGPGTGTGNSIKTLRGSSSSGTTGCSSSNNDKEIGTNFTFSLLDPLGSGVAKIESLLDYWSSIGLSHEVGLDVLSRFGIESNYDSTVDLNDIEKCIEDELYSNKNILPWIQVAILMYRSEVQFLKSSLETTTHERNKIQSVNDELTKQSQILAQEIDEQNAKLEISNKILIDNLIHKYEEQIAQMRADINAEKNILGENIRELEEIVSALKSDESRSKVEIGRLQSENKNLEREIERLNENVRILQTSKIQLESEICIYQSIQKNLQEMEMKSMESNRKNEDKLNLVQSEVQILRDTNDELNSQLYFIKEEFKTFKINYGIATRGIRSKGYLRTEDEGGGEDSISMPSLVSDQFDLKSQTTHLNSIDNVINVKSTFETMTIPKSIEIFTQHKAIQTDATAIQNENADKDNEKDDEFQQKLNELNAEKTQLQNQINDLESNLNLLAVEYEKTEDYWSSKLAEERISYEMEKNINDDKLQEIQEKIKEYEELLGDSLTNANKLTPVVEYWSLEKQIGELECENYEIRGAVEKYEKQISDFKGKLEGKTKECNHMEDEIRHLHQKCHDYENRITRLLACNDDEMADLKASEAQGRKREEELLKRIAELEAKLLNNNNVGQSHQKSSLLIDSSYKCVKSMPHFNTCINTHRSASFMEAAMNQRIKYTHVDVNYLTQLKQKIKQYEEQCWGLSQTINDKDKYSEQLLAEMKYQHHAEIQNYESLIETNQQIIDRQSLQIQNQEEIIKDLITANNKKK